MMRFALVAAAVTAFGLASASTAAAPAHPAVGAIFAGGEAKVLTVSCTSRGTCAAAGSYTDRSHRGQAFVVSEDRGTWHTATPVPGARLLNAGGGAGIHEVSCTSEGNCGAGGWYTDRRGHIQGMVVAEVHGTWKRAIPVPGLAALNTGGYAVVESLSCASAGNCSAGGLYSGAGYNNLRPFVADEVRGTWRPAEEIPGSLIATAVLAEVLSVSCGAPGDCAAGGYYSTGHDHAFVANEVRGTWRQAEEVPGTAPLNVYLFARVTSVSCPSAGNCAAGGFYASSTGIQPFVADETSGTWGKARPVRPPPPQRPFKDAQIQAVSCASAGNCGAGGIVFHPSVRGALLVAEANGKWSAGALVPVAGALNNGPDVLSISCASRGNCSAGGIDVGHRGLEAFVVTESKGVWGKASGVPGLAALNAGGIAQVSAVSCAAAGYCSAGGFYDDRPLHQQAFVVKQKAGRWGTALEVPGF